VKDETPISSCTGKPDESGSEQLSGELRTDPRGSRPIANTAGVRHRIPTRTRLPELRCTSEPTKDHRKIASGRSWPDSTGRIRQSLTEAFVSHNLRFVATYESVLEALGDKTRRKIVQILRTRPASVAELAAQLPVSRPAISQHLRVLRDSDLVTFETLGTRNIYQLRPAGLETLRRWLDDFWGTVLDDFAAHVDSHTRRESIKKTEEGQSHA
jgi:DNA-binding transcriptional ArsR family regulator